MSARHLRTNDPFPALPNDGKLRLLSMRFCPYAQRARLVLNAKRIPHHTININLHHKPLWLNRLSSAGKVPALGMPGQFDASHDDHGYVIESLVIADRLDEDYDEVKLRSDDVERCGQDSAWVQRFDEVIAKYYTIVLNGSDDETIDALLGLLDEFEGDLRRRGGKFYGFNDRPGMLDYMIWPWMERMDALMELIGEDKGVADRYAIRSDRFPLLTEWTTHMLADPAVQACCLSTDIHFKYAHLRRAKADDIFDILDTY